MPQLLDMIDEAKKHIQSKTKIQPEYGIILGTGLGKLVDSIDIDAEIPYETIPHFAVSTVEEHAGKLILGKLSANRSWPCRAGSIFMKDIRWNRSFSRSA